MATRNKSKPVNQFENEMTSVYEIEPRSSRRNMFEIDIEITTGDEQHMLEALHTQAVAASGRFAVAEFSRNHIGGMASHSSYVMAEAMEQIYRVETAANVGRFEKPLQNFDNRLLDDSGRYICEVNGIAARQMYKDEMENIYPQKNEPKRKGVLRGFKDFWLGEE